MKTNSVSWFLIILKASLVFARPQVINAGYQPIKPSYVGAGGTNFVGQIIPPGKPWPASADEYVNFSVLSTKRPSVLTSKTPNFEDRLPVVTSFEDPNELSTTMKTAQNDEKSTTPASSFAMTGIFTFNEKTSESTTVQIQTVYDKLTDSPQNTTTKPMSVTTDRQFNVPAITIPEEMLFTSIPHISTENNGSKILNQSVPMQNLNEVKLLIEYVSNTVKPEEVPSTSQKQITNENLSLSINIKQEDVNISRTKINLKPTNTETSTLETTTNSIELEETTFFNDTSKPTIPVPSQPSLGVMKPMEHLKSLNNQPKRPLEEKKPGRNSNFTVSSLPSKADQILKQFTTRVESSNRRVPIKRMQPPKLFMPTRRYYSNFFEPTSMNFGYFSNGNFGYPPRFPIHYRFFKFN